MSYDYSIFGETMVKQDTRRDINPALLEIENHTREFHAPIVTASFHAQLPGNAPTPIADEALILLRFTLDTDLAFRQFKIPGSYVGDPSFHIHWTKSADADESTKAVRWEVSYHTFPSTSSEAGEGNATPTVAEIEDTYDDSEVTTRNIYRTLDVAMTGFQPGYYLTMRVRAITPNGTPLANEPALFSLDLKFTQYINNGM